MNVRKAGQIQAKAKRRKEKQAIIMSALLLPAAFGSASAEEATGKIVVRSAPAAKEEFVVGTVKAVTSPSINDKLLKNTGIVSRNQLVEVEIMEGPHKGSTFLIQNEITDNPSFNINVKPGREVVLSVVSDSGNTEVNIADYNRLPVLIILGVIFTLAFVAFGGMKGLRSLAGVACAIALIGFVLLPLSLKGYNPLLTSALICFAAAAATIISVAGLSRKSAAAMIGTIGGVLVAGISAQVVIESAPLTGLSSEEAQILRGSVLTQPPEFFAGLLAAAMLIGALGVIMDVGISIASAVQELAQTDPRLDVATLYRKGMNVGRDIMGTMTSTLILAYAGGALPLLLLMANTPSIKLLNLDLVATEVAAALTGSLGLVCTVPLTAVVAARLMSGKQRRPPGAAGAGDPFAQFDHAKTAATEGQAMERRLVRRTAIPYPR